MLYFAAGLSSNTILSENNKNIYLLLNKISLILYHTFSFMLFLTFPFKFYLYKKFKLSFKDYLLRICTFMCMIIFLRIIKVSEGTKNPYS